MTELYEKTGQLPGSLEMAYLGDAIYEVYVRRMLVGGGEHVRALHKKAIALVCAGAQARALAQLNDVLSEEEKAVARRARNAHQTPTKHADAGEYHQATALEAVIGYLYLTGQQPRLEEIMRRILDGAKE